MKRAGFTILELLMAMTLVALVLVGLNTFIFSMSATRFGVSGGHSFSGLSFTKISRLLGSFGSVPSSGRRHIASF